MRIWKSMLPALVLSFLLPPCHAAAAARDPGPASRSSTPDGAGGQYIAWADVRDGSGDIFLLRVTSSGAVAAGWPAGGLAVCNAPGDQFEAGVLPDGANGALVAWADYRDSWRTPNGYAQRINSAGVPQWTTNGVKVIDSLYTAESTVAPDGIGGLLVAWSAPGATDADIFATRFNGSGALAAGWSAERLVCAATEPQHAVVLTNDGAGGAIIAWEDERTGNGDTHVFAQRVSAAGADQWAADGIQLDASLLGATGPAICSDGGSGALVFWSDFMNPDLIVGQRLNSAGVAQWTAGGVGVDGGDTSTGDLLATPDGLNGAIVLYTDSPAAVSSLRAQRVNGSGASQWGVAGASVVSLAGSSPDQPQVVADGTGAGYFVWQDWRNVSGPLEGPDLYAQRISATGTPSWTANGAVVSVAAGTQQAVTAAPDGAGGLSIAWHDDRNFDTDIFAQRFNAAGAAQLAANGIAVFSDPGAQVGEVVLQTDDGGAIVFLNEKSGGEYDIRARKFNADGSPAGASVAICSATGDQGLSGAIDDGAGGAIVLWVDTRNDNNDLYAQRVNGSAVPQWTVNGVAICTAVGSQQLARMVTDGANGAIVAWQDDRNLGMSANSDVHAQRVNAAGAVQWAANGVAVCADPGTQQGVALASDGAGGAIVSWSDLRTFLTAAIYSQRLNSAGAPQWAANGVSIASFAGFSFARISDAVMGTSNDAIVLFSQTVVDLGTGAFTTLLHTQKVSSAGAPQWGAEGATICDVSSLCSNEHIVNDGAGGAYVGWSDGRNEVSDVYLQRVNSAGTVQWAANGIAVCNAASWQHMEGLTRDSAGDAYLTWADQRAGQPDIYAQRVNLAGAPQWTANGVLVAAAARGQFLSAIAPWKSAAPQRVYVAWTDNRAGGTRYVYLQQLNSAGASQWLANGVTRAQLALVSVAAESDRVRLVWNTSEAVVATVSRRSGGQDWLNVGETAADGSGMLVFEDRDVVAGSQYDYRLSFLDNGVRVTAGQTSVLVPLQLRFALEGPQPNPVTDVLRVSFTLPVGEPATIELLDVTGRRVLVRELAAPAAGRHTLALEDGVPYPAGIYFVRLTQAGRSLTTRAALLR